MPTGLPAYDRRRYFDILQTQLMRERSSWETHWQELADFIMPRRLRFQTSETNRGTKKNNRIINNSATLAARTLRSGMMAGVTSSARRWFKLATEDLELNEYYSVKLWLHEVTERMNAVMNGSNLYNSFPVVYGDLGVFGTSAMFVMESDTPKLINTGVVPLGSYWVSANAEGFVDTFLRQCRMTVRQIVERFVKQNEKSGSFVWSNVSTTVKNLWDGGQTEEAVDVHHIVHPNEMYDPRLMMARYKKYASCYYEKSESNKILGESGYDEFPVMVPRWDITSGDVYGSSPGMDALGDVRALQTLEKRKAQAVEKMVNPPMTAPTSLRNQKTSILPGDVTYVDVRDGQEGFRPAHETRFSVKEMVLDIGAHQERIRRAFYEDLFLMLTLTDRREITAREVAERHEEKLLALGPVIGQLNSDLLDPLIDRVFEIMLRAGRIPPPPPELQQGQDLKVEYISMMAQAQKLVNLGSTERFATFVANLAEAVPTVLDKVDFDEIVEEHGSMMGVAPRVLRSPDQVNAIRQQREERAAMMEKAQQADQLAKAARNLSQTTITEDNALTRIADRAASVL